MNEIITYLKKAKALCGNVTYKALVFKSNPEGMTVLSGYVVDDYFVDENNRQIYDFSYFDRITNLDEEFED